MKKPLVHTGTVEAACQWKRLDVEFDCVSVSMLLALHVPVCPLAA